MGAKLIINKTIFKKTVLSLSKDFESPSVKSSVRFKAIPNKILINKILERENRIQLYKNCLKFLKTRVDLDLALIPQDVWSH